MLGGLPPSSEKPLPLGMGYVTLLGKIESCRLSLDIT
jgi:hypothetical protein